jgi:hypothetical protein
MHVTFKVSKMNDIFKIQYIDCFILVSIKYAIHWDFHGLTRGLKCSLYVGAWS